MELSGNLKSGSFTLSTEKEMFKSSIIPYIFATAVTQRAVGAPGGALLQLEKCGALPPASEKQKIKVMLG